MLSKIINSTQHPYVIAAVVSFSETDSSFKPCALAIETYKTEDGPEVSITEFNDCAVVLERSRDDRDKVPLRSNVADVMERLEHNPDYLLINEILSEGSKSQLVDLITELIEQYELVDYQESHGEHTVYHQENILDIVSTDEFDRDWWTAEADENGSRAMIVLCGLDDMEKYVQQIEHSINGN